jgi:hypothetical protein
LIAVLGGVAAFADDDWAVAGSSVTNIRATMPSAMAKAARCINPIAMFVVSKVHAAAPDA